MTLFSFTLVFPLNSAFVKVTPNYKLVDEMIGVFFNVYGSNYV